MTLSGRNLATSAGSGTGDYRAYDYPHEFVAASATWADPDGDGSTETGVPLGFDTMDALLAPEGDATSGLTLTFTRKDDSEGEADFFVEFGNDLFDTDVPPASSVPAESGTVDGVTYTITENGTDPDTVEANIPASNGPDGKLFGRVGATQN